MKKFITAAAAMVFVTSSLYASYIVVLRDGTQYKARAKWTVSNGKALIALENGNTLQLDPALIDVAQTDRVNRLGLGNVKVLAQETTTAPAEQEPSTLGSTLRLRTPRVEPTPDVAGTSSNPVPTGANAPGGVGQAAIAKFEAAYEKVGVFDQKILSPAPGQMKVSMTTDNEERVFGVITATAYLIQGVPRLTGVSIENVELKLRTSVNGSAGLFQMTRADAELLNLKRITPAQYFVQKVIY